LQAEKLLEEILELCGVFPNITIALHIFVTFPASVASGERNFTVFKQLSLFKYETRMFEWFRHAQYQL
jgi:hypothetical protein